MNIFTFVIDDKILFHRKSALNIGVSVKTNNVGLYKKSIQKMLDLVIQKESELFQSSKYLGKASKNHRPDQIDLEIDTVIRIFNVFKNKVDDVFYENKQEFLKQLNSIIELLYNNRQTFQYEHLVSAMESFVEWTKSNLVKKIDMCEKLSKLDGKMLRAIIIFSEKDNSFETQFTKYVLNLEHFSDSLHHMLRQEILDAFVTEYQKLEKEHFELKKNEGFDKEQTTVKKFTEITEKILYNYSLIEKFDPLFLKSQAQYEKIKETCETIIKDNYLIAQKFNTFYDFFNSPDIIKKYCNKKDQSIWVRKLFLKLIVFANEFKYNQFLNLKDVDFEKVVVFLRDKDVEINIDKMMFSNFQKIEPDISERLVNNILTEFRKKEEIDVFMPKENYMIRKAKKNVFENNQFYSHILIVYEFMPNSVSGVKNKYTINSGFDKVSLDTKILKFSGELFSPFINKMIKYDLFIEIASYHMNTSNYLICLTPPDKINAKTESAKKVA